MTKLLEFQLLTQVSVMCYNVLCDKYATRNMYGYCPSWALSWENRRKGIMQEIKNCDADIITLQVGHTTAMLSVGETPRVEMIILPDNYYDDKRQSSIRHAEFSLCDSTPSRFRLHLPNVCRRTKSNITV